jgi:hypothetical protein
VVAPLRADILNNDLTLIYLGTRIGLEHGWSHIYSLALQHDLFTQLRPGASFTDGERFISPPVLAWALIPLTIIGPRAAVYVWLAASLVGLAAAWWVAAPGRGLVRGLWLLGALAWYPVLYGVGLAQPNLLVLAVVAAGWRLAEGGRPYLAGLVLGLSTLKPQLTLLLPLVLLAAGHWRIAAAWFATAAILTVASLVAIGGQGVTDYRALLDEAQRVINNRYFTLAYVLGPGTLSYVAQGAVAAVAMIGGYLNRRASLARVFALGLVATTLGATYWHLQDFAVLVLAAWLFWRDNPPAWQRWWLLVIVVGGELAWPLGPLPILIGIAVWFGCMVAPPRRPAPDLVTAPA